MSHKPIQIVDENDQPLRPGTMDEAQKQGLWHRIVRIIIEDENGSLLLQKRSSSMRTFPDCWDTSAAGHVDAEEDYLTAAMREMAEETGLKDVSLKEIEYFQSQWTYKSLMLNRFNKTYKAVVKSSQKFTADIYEVSELKWFTVGEIKALYKKQPDVLTDGIKYFLKLNENHEHQAAG